MEIGRATPATRRTPEDVRQMLEEIRRQFDELSEQWRELVAEISTPPEAFGGDRQTFDEFMKRTEELGGLLTRTAETLRSLAPSDASSEQPRSRNQGKAR